MISAKIGPRVTTHASFAINYTPQEALAEKMIDAVYDGPEDCER